MNVLRIKSTYITDFHQQTFFIFLMKRIIFIALILVPTNYYNSKKMEAGASEILVSIELSKSYQTIEGWGSSLCWWAGRRMGSGKS
jgi:hypothetical protein